MTLKRLPGFILLLPFFICFNLSLAYASKSGYAEHEAARQVIEEMVNDHGFERDYLLQLFSEAERKEKILEAIARPAEKTLEWFEYRKIFMTEDRIEQGKAFMAQYAQALARAERELGVPKEIITAIIGVETRYGKHKGNYRVLDALTTLGFDYPPRAKFFSSELKQVLLLAREQGFDLREMKGSYAGAMGYGQFIASSYRHYAIDFDGDKIVDILNNPVDAIGSVANYFVSHKWQKGQAIAFQLKADNSARNLESFLYSDLKPKHTLKEFASKGIKLPDGLNPESSGKILFLKGDQGGGEYWLTLDNFYVITRYNHSHLYAMAVYHLALALGLPE
jgi:membrane-bound lytic murein transglycosylase B